MLDQEYSSEKRVPTRSLDNKWTKICQAHIATCVADARLLQIMTYCPVIAAANRSGVKTKGKVALQAQPPKDIAKLCMQSTKYAYTASCTQAG